MNITDRIEAGDHVEFHDGSIGGTVRSVSPGWTRLILVEFTDGYVSSFSEESGLVRKVT